MYYNLSLKQISYYVFLIIYIACQYSEVAFSLQCIHSYRLEKDNIDANHLCSISFSTYIKEAAINKVASSIVVITKDYKLKRIIKHR